MAPEFSFRDSATLRRRLEVSSLLALRAVAQNAELVQQPPRRARRGADRQQCLEADLICNSRNCNTDLQQPELQQPNCNSRTTTVELQQPNYNSRESGGELLAPRARQDCKSSYLSLLVYQLKAKKPRQQKHPSWWLRCRLSSASI